MNSIKKKFLFLVLSSDGSKILKWSLRSGQVSLTMSDQTENVTFIKILNWINAATASDNKAVRG
jgi:hypothetical protein